jgi:hypothetical protein
LPEICILIVEELARATETQGRLKIGTIKTPAQKPRRIYFFSEVYFSMSKLPKSSEIIKKIEDYIQNNTEGLPILRECCFLNSWDYDDFCELFKKNPKIKRAANRLLCKKLINLEKFGVIGNFNKPMCVFLLERLDSEISKNLSFSRIELVDNSLLEIKGLADRLEEYENFY